ncbi:pH-response regulator protein palC [Leucoagaricus sp. SymC.cos]|nr:pH-response regulator protein palC [Leucoagaricus sp. SymC.cos]
MYLYELPTTGAVSFSDFCVDQSTDKIYSTCILEATQARANIRAALKASKRTEDGTKDYLSLTKLLEDYIPLLRGLISCVAHDDIGLKSEPSFSWRTTLSNSILNNSPRLSVPGLYADLAFTLLTYAFTLSNLAHAVVQSVGPYERDRALKKEQRERKDEQINVAFGFLCKASGVFAYIANSLLPEWEVSRAGGLNGFSRPPDLRQEVNSALVKLSLADAQTLAIRKFLSKAAFDSNISPGLPLPASHPSPSFIAKLHLECLSLYASAKSLAKASGSGDISAETRKYLTDRAAFHAALAHKWLGVELGENGLLDQAGDAVAFLAWAKKELEDLKENSLTLHLGKGDKEKARKSQMLEELESTTTFYKYYKKANDSLHFQPVPSQAELQARIPTGLAAAQLRPYTPPAPAFGPGSVDDMQRQTQELDLDDQEQNQFPALTSNSSPKANYAGAGSYF